jgi:site-specific DNA recombinase
VQTNSPAAIQPNHLARFGPGPEGSWLLEAAALGSIDAVVIYKLDRLGRTAKVLLDAHEQLEHLGVAIISATEPFDTRTSIGRFVFQLLGWIAELERATIRDRMNPGRDARRARADSSTDPFRTGRTSATMVS